MNTSTLELLLIDLEEEFSAEGALALHEISWTLAGLGVDRSDPTFAPLAREAYTDSARSTRTSSWRRELAGPAGDGHSRLEEDDVEVDLEPKSDAGTPILFLVRSDDLADARTADWLAS